MEIGKKIKLLRNGKGITQETLAAALSVSPQAVSKWETGSTTPDVQLLPEIAVYFGVTIDELFSLSDDREFDRIQNMLWDSRRLPQHELERAERRLLENISRDYRPGDSFRLLADIYNHQAVMFREQAAAYARQALAASPNDRPAVNALNLAMGGYLPDWSARNRHKLIDEIKSMIGPGADLPLLYMWLLENLIADHRLEEATRYADLLAQIDTSHCSDYYRAFIAWRAGDQEALAQGLHRLEHDYPGDWTALFGLGDLLATMGRYSEAIRYYRMSIDLQHAPRQLDPLEALAHVFEIQGDPSAAIAAYEEELSVLSQDWNTTTGEAVDSIRREIAHLSDGANLRPSGRPMAFYSHRTTPFR